MRTASIPASWAKACKTLDPRRLIGLDTAVRRKKLPRDDLDAVVVLFDQLTHGITTEEAALKAEIADIRAMLQSKYAELRALRTQVGTA